MANTNPSRSRQRRRRIAVPLGIAVGALIACLSVSTPAHAGEGHTPGNCGEASLYFDSNSGHYEIFLFAYGAVINQATYAIWTDGILEVGQGGRFEVLDQQAFADGRLVDPGINVHNVYVLGEAYTGRGLCALYVSAPYTPHQF